MLSAQRLLTQHTLLTLLLSPHSIELGVERDESGIAKCDGKKQDYEAAPKKSADTQGPKSKL